MIRYILSSTDIKVEEVNRAIEEVTEKGGNITMSTAAKLVQQGMQQGMQQEKLITAKNMLMEGFNEQTIMKLTGLSIEEIRGINIKAKKEVSNLD